MGLSFFPSVILSADVLLWLTSFFFFFFFFELIKLFLNICSEFYILLMSIFSSFPTDQLCCFQFFILTKHVVMHIFVLLYDSYLRFFLILLTKEWKIISCNSLLKGTKVIVDIEEMSPDILGNI